MTLFLSYARADDEPFVARLHAGLTTAGFAVWWDRVSMPNRGGTFRQEIRDAVAGQERVILVVGPRALASDQVAAEWRFALEAGKPVHPLLRLSDYGDLPEDLALYDALDFRDDAAYAARLETLLRQLSEPVVSPCTPAGVPTPPRHFLPRRDLLRAVKRDLLADVRGPVVVTGAAARTGLHGMGGIGKSVAAAALAWDVEVRRAFRDGVVWATLGQEPDLVALQRDVAHALGDPGRFETEVQGAAHLRGLLRPRAVLLVLDDVWHAGHARAFDVLGPRCRALVTTRDAALITALGGAEHRVELLTEAEARALLAGWIGRPAEALPNEAVAVLDQCQRLPLALAICGALVRDGMTWPSLLAKFRDAEPDLLAHDLADYPHPNVFVAIDIGVRSLPDADQERFLELAVFPRDEAVPEAAVVALWRGTGGLTDHRATDLLARLARRSLVQRERGSGRVSLHNLIHDYARSRASDRAALHAKLLGAYGLDCPAGWASGPDDGYFLTHLRHHLAGAGRHGELAGLVQDRRWLERKAAGVAFDLVADFQAALAALQEAALERRRITLLAEAFVRDTHFIARHPAALFQCLFNAAWWYDGPEVGQHQDAPGGLPNAGLADLVQGWQPAGRPWLRLLRPGEPLGTGQRAVLVGHTGQVQGLAFSPDGRLLASAARDNTARVWDAENGEAIHRLRGHTGHVYSVTFSPDGRVVATGSWDHTVRFWDPVTGTELPGSRVTIGRPVQGLAYLPDGRLVVGAADGQVRVIAPGDPARTMTLSGHADQVRAVAVSADGRLLASASVDRTACVWDARDGTLLFPPLRGHSKGLFSVALSPDGTLLVTGAADGDHGINGWDVAAGGELDFRRVLEERAVMGLAFSADGQRFASVTYGPEQARSHTVRLWDRQGRELRRYPAPWWGTSLALRADGERIATGDADGRIRIWDTRVEPEARTPLEPPAALTSLAFSPNGLLVGGARDGTGRLWDGATGVAIRPPLEGHTGEVVAVAASPTGRLFASGSKDGTVRLWDRDGGTGRTLTGPVGAVRCVAFTADGEAVLAGSDDGTVRVWDARDGKQVGAIAGGAGSVRAVAISPDRRSLAGGFSDGTVRIWRLDDGREERVLMGHANTINGVAFSPDGLRLGSAAADGTMRVWDTTTGESVRAVVGLGDVAALAGGPASHPWHALSRGRDRQTVVESADGQVVARLPIAFSRLVAHPDGRTWAGLDAGALWLFRLEDAPVTS